MALQRAIRITAVGVITLDLDGSCITYTEEQAKKLMSQLKFIPEGTKMRVEITEWNEAKEEELLRTEAQNRYYHKMLDLICEHTGDDHLDLHDTLKAKFLGRPKVIGDKEYIIVPSTTGLNSKNFGAYIERVHRFAAEELEIVLPEATNIF